MHDDKPKWAKRVQRYKIAQLYEQDAAGIVDEELIDEVGFAILTRCISILTASAAHRGRVPCPFCGKIIDHKWDEFVHCEDCDWGLPWKEYHKTYKRKQLSAGGMQPFLEAYVDEFPKAATPQQKMRLIDILISRYHGEYEGGGHRPGGLNLIGGKNREVRAFLNELARGITRPGREQTHREWVEKVRRERPSAWQDPNET